MNIEEINGAIKEIADNFGLVTQQLKLIEELGELTREISKDIAMVGKYQMKQFQKLQM